MTELTQARLKELLHYNPDTGIFTRLTKPRNGLNIGDIAGSLHSNGYIVIEINYKKYKAHRLAWLYVAGSFPPDMMDHKNRIRNDNRFINLREATRGQNGANGKRQSHNKSGKKGVCWNKGKGKWVAQISVRGKVKHLGVFTCKDKAHATYCKAADKYHGEFANHG